VKQEHTLTGIVLCGGKSTRMGSDKGLLVKEDGKTWAEHAFRLLNDLDLPVKLSINPSQEGTYGKIFHDTLLIKDSVAIPGPLVGLLSVLQQLNNQDLIILACDMTDVTAELVQQLITAYQKERDKYDFFVFKNGTEYEPMLGIYTKKGLQNVYDLFSKGKLEKFSMKYILETSSTFAIPVSDLQEKHFKNYNSREELLD
jgi:molybdenum cofactor guanylyltransferase